jgi:hypothetical protein
MRSALVATAFFLLLFGLPPLDAGERFSFPGDGLVADHDQRLIWMRCSLGQRAVDGRCQGEAERLSWTEAVVRTDVLASADCPWRIPEFHELRSLLQPAGSGQALDMRAFPDTPDGWFWTSVRAGGHSQYDCFVDFAGEGRTRCNMGGRLHLRAVMTWDDDARLGCSSGAASP